MLRRETVLNTARSCSELCPHSIAKGRSRCFDASSETKLGGHAIIFNFRKTTLVVALFNTS